MLWGTTGTAQALAPEAAQPHAVGALRLLIASLALVPFALIRRALPSKRPWPLLATAIAAIGVAAYQPLFFAAVATTGVAIGTVVGIGSSPILAGLLVWAVDGERPNSRWMIATALAVLGTALLFVGQAESGVVFTGVLLALGAGAAYAVYVRASKELLEDHEPDGVIAVVFGLSALILLPLLFLADLSWVTSPRGAVSVLYLGLVATALAYVLFIRGLDMLPVGSTVTLSLAEPLTAAALGLIVLNERLGPTALLGAFLILLGLAIIGIQRESEPPGK